MRILAESGGSSMDIRPERNYSTRMTTPPERRYRGVFPVVPTTFRESGELDIESQKRCVDFMIDAGSNGVCILANFSEQFVLSDHEREVLTTAILRHIAGRVPVIVTTTHFSSRVCVERSRRAEDEGAAMVMVMPPYHGATIRVAEPQIYDFFAELSAALRIPIMIQDAPVSGTVLTAAFLARMARELDHVAYFKIESAGAATKLRELIRLGGNAVEGPWDGEEGITLFADLEAGATGAMTGGGYPDGIRQVVDAYEAGRREEAFAAYQRWLPLINYENRQCGLLACKALMKEGGIIDCDAPRRPLAALHPDVRAGLIETARRLNPMVLRNR
jgi:4-hydroxy-tetrahydrodipicolinate synthase/2-keto-3-deoxy-L-arabinonate dehydratase